MRPAARIVRTAPTGSTIPDRTPPAKALVFPIPSERRGIEIMAPSGKFWMAIPIERAMAPIIVIWA